MNFMVVDLWRGGIDGFYSTREGAVSIAETRNRYRRDLCVVAVELIGPIPSGGIRNTALMAMRNSRLADVFMQIEPPDDFYLQSCIEQTTGLLRDLYDMKVRKEVLVEMAHELYMGICEAPCPTQSKRRQKFTDDM